MNSVKQRRLNYLINKDFQLRYVAKVLFGIIIMALIVSLTIYYTTWSRIMDAFYYLPAIASQFASLFSSVNQALFTLLLIFIGLATIISVFISHRIAGPMFRFEKSLGSIGEGDLSIRVSLRKNDEFHYLAEDFNCMLDQLNQRIKAERQAVEKIDQLLRDQQSQEKKQGLDKDGLEMLISLFDEFKTMQAGHFKIKS